MKVTTHYYITSLLLLLALLATSCKKEGKDDNTPVAPRIEGKLQVGESSIQLRKGERILLSMSGGSGQYTTHIANVGVATAHPAKGGIELHGIRAGEELLTIKDAVTSETQRVQLTIVNEYHLKATPNTAVLYAGTSRIIHIAGGSGAYTTTFAPTGVAEVVEQTEGKLVVRAVAQGTTELTVVDNEYQVSTTIPLSVELRPLVLSEQELTLLYGQRATIRITKGNGTYEVQVPPSTPAHVKATLNGTSVVIEALSLGEETITIKDVVSGETKEVKVTVPPSDLQLASPNVLMPATGTFYLPIASGNGQYEVQVIDDEAKGKLSATVENGLIKITSTEAVVGRIEVTDLQTNQTQQAMVTARALVRNPHFDKHELTITAGGQQGVINLLDSYSGYDHYYYWRPTYDATLLQVDMHRARIPLYSIFGHKPGSTILTITDYSRNVVAEVLITVLPK